MLSWARPYDMGWPASNPAYHSGGRILYDSSGKHLSGKLAFDDTPMTTHWVKVSEFTTHNRLSNYISHAWQLPKPDVIITVVGTHVTPPFLCSSPS